MTQQQTPRYMPGKISYRPGLTRPAVVDTQTGYAAPFVETDVDRVAMELSTGLRAPGYFIWHTPSEDRKVTVAG